MSIRTLRTRLFVSPLEDRTVPATFTVNATSDSGTGSGTSGDLRYCVTQSNAATGPNTINFDTTLFASPQTITLGSVLPTFTQPVTLQGTSARNVLISGNNAVQIMRTGTTNAAGITLNDLTLLNGHGAPGGGVFVATNNVLNLNRCTVSGNVTTSNGGGVYFFSGGQFNASGCTFAANQGAANGGGAVYLFGNITSTISNCTFTGNTSNVTNGGGAIRLQAFSGTLNVRNSTITGNSTSTGTGGGISGAGGTVNIVSSIVSGNTGGASPNIASGTINVNFSAIDNTAGFTFSATSGNNLSTANSTVSALVLGSLANNGGPTDTMALGSGSTGINAGSNPGNLANDQRGFGYLRSFSTGTTPVPDIGAFEAQPVGVPVATPTAANVTTAGGTTYTFTVAYADLIGSNQGINVTSVINNNNAVRVAGPGGYNVAANYSSIDFSTNGTPRTVSYTITPPGGSWLSTANGSYSIVMQGNQAADLDGNFVQSGTIGTFTVAIPVPIATASAPNVTVAGTTPNTFTVTYTAIAPNLINFSTLGTGDVTLTGPGGYNVTPTFVSAVPSSNAASIVATYSYTPPGGSWDGFDNGTYVITMVAGQVGDTATPSANTVAPGPLATFTVLVPLSLVVTNTNDSGAGSLRDAITQCNALTGTADTISFQPGLTGTITLASALPTITEALTIVGPGAGVISVSGNNAVRPFTINGAGVFNVSISGLTITGGNASGEGGGVYAVDENLSLDRVVIAGNAVNGQGGGIGFGSSGTLLLTNSTVSGNTSTEDGGGLYFFFGGSFVIRNTTISGNTADTGGSGVGGGGIYFFGPANTTGLPPGFQSGTLLLQNSTIANNTTSRAGGGIVLPAFSSILLVQNSTISGNAATSSSASYPGGGIALPSGTLTLQNSVVAGNSNSNAADIASNGIVNANFSAIGSSTGYTLSASSGNNVAPGTNLMLGTLGNNGGPTQTIVPQAGSPLLNAGSNILVPVTLQNDQRGFPFFRIYGTSVPAVVDIGSVERQPGPPFVLLASSTLTYTENDPPLLIDGALTVNDFDSANLTSVAVTITNYVAGQDVLNYNPAALPTGVIADTTLAGTITFSGTASLAAYQTLLRTVTYANTSENPNTTTRVITFTAIDDSTPATIGPATSRSIAVVSVNDPPVNTVPANPSVTSGTTAPIPGFSVADPDVGTGNLTVTISVGAGLGTFTGTGFTSGAGTNSITVTGTLAAVNAALATLTYSAPVPPQFVAATMVSNDNGNTGTGGTLITTTNFSIFANDPLPVVTTTSGTVTYTENALPVVVDPGVTVTDNGTQLSGATVRITTGYSAATDSLAFTPQPGVTGSFSSATGTLTLTGNATLTAYQTVLRSVTFVASGDNPTGGNRTVVFVVTDLPAIGPPGSSVPVSRTVTVIPVNDPPTNTVPPGPFTTPEETPITITGTISVADPDNASLTVTLSAAHGTVALTAAGGAMVTGSGTASVVVTGTIAQINQTLATKPVYTPVLDYNGPDTLTVTSFDGSLTDVDGIPIIVTPVNDPPVIGGITGTLTYQLGHAPGLVAPSATVVDVDSPDFDTGTLTAAITAGGQAADKLGIQNVGTGSGQVGVSGSTVTFGGTPIGTFTGGTGGAPLVLTLNASSSPTAVQAVLQNVTFTTVVGPGILGNRTLSFTLSDGDGGPNNGVSNTPTDTVTVAPSTAPVITIASGSLGYTENDPLTVLDGGATVTDVDSPDFTGGKLTIDFAAGGTADDRLVFRNVGFGPGQVGVVGSTVSVGGIAVGTFAGGTDGSTPLVLTFTGAPDPAAVQELVRNVTYQNVSDNPVAGLRTIEFRVDDGNLGVSTPATRTVTLTAINDPPVNTLPAGPLSTLEDTSLPITGVSIADPDAGANPVRVTLSSATGAVTLTATAGVTLTGNGTGLVVAVGSIANVNTALGGMTFLPAQDYNGTSDVQILTDDQGFSPGPALTTTNTFSVTVIAVNDPPVIGSVGGTVTYQLGHAPGLVAPSATVVDVDSADFDTGALTIAITAGGQAADKLGIQNVGTGAGQIGVSGSTVTFGGTPIGTFTGGTGGAPLVVTFNASATPAAAQALVRSVTFETVVGPGILGNRTLSFTLSDGDGGPNNGTSATVTDTVSVAPSTAPVITIASGSLGYTENDPQTAIDATATVVDPDSPSFDHGKLTAAFTAGGTADDRLEIRNVGNGVGQVGVTGSTVTYEGTPIGTFTGGTDGSTPLVVSFNANSTPTAVQAVVRAVAFRNVSDDPQTLSRTVRLQLDDGGLGVSTPVSRTVTVTAVNDPPVNHLPAAPLAGLEDATLAITGLSVSDPDAENFPIKVTLAATHGTVAITGTVSVTLTGNGTGTVTLTGPISGVNAALSSLAFTPAPGYSGPAGIQITTNDQGAAPPPALSSTNVLAIDVGPVNHPPAITVPAGPLVTDEDVALTVTGVSIADRDSSSWPAVVTLTVGNGTLQLNTAVPGGVNSAQVTGSGTGLVTITAPLAQLNATLAAAGLVYTPGQDFHGSDTLLVMADDQGSGVGPDATAANQMPITVTEVDDPPSFTLSLSTITLNEDAGTKTIAGLVQNASPGPADESGQTLTYAVTVGSVTGNLAFSIAPSFNPATGVLTFAAAPNTNGTAALKVTLTDSGGASATHTLNLVVNAVNDAPTFTLAGNPPAAKEGTGAQSVSGFVTAFNPGPSDEASQTPTYLVSVTGTTGGLTFTAPPAISPAGVLTYTADPFASGTATVSVAVRDSGGTANGGQDTSAAQTFTITVNPIVRTPIVTTDTAGAREDGGPITIDVLANDSSPGRVLTIASVTPASAGGTVSIGGNRTTLTYQPVIGFVGTDTFTYTVTDGRGGTATGTVNVTVASTGVAHDWVAVGSAIDSRVRVFNARTGQPVASFFAFGPSYNFGVKVAVGDVNGDGRPDVIVGAGLGGAPHVKVIDGARIGQIGPDGTISDSALLASFFAYDSSVRGGVNVAVGDVNGDGFADLIVGPGVGGGPHVKVFDGTRLGSGTLLASFFAYNPSVRGGLSVAAADVNGDGITDIITGAGPGGAAHVKVVDGRKLNLAGPDGQIGVPALLANFFAYDPSFVGGVNVAAGDFNGDGRAEVITGAGPSGAPHVKVFDTRTGQLEGSFLAFDPTSSTGIDVGYRLRMDGVPTLVAGELGGAGRVRTYAGPAFAPQPDLDRLLEPSFLGGVEVG
jgi:hypothetical protein